MTTGPSRTTGAERRAERDRVAVAKQAIRRGSKSFALAAGLLDAETRSDALLLYAWCRHCDDVIDGQSSGHGRHEPQLATSADALAIIRGATRAALTGTAVDPVFTGLGDVVRRNAIPERYVLDHLDGFAMDVGGRRYGTFADTLDYCYLVAGVVGIMMGHVMGVRDRDTLIRACDLGIAFQLTNIARDIVDDARIGRIYCPSDWIDEEGIPSAGIADLRHRQKLARVAERLICAAQPYYDSAAVGIRALPLRAAWAISTASAVYHAIGVEVQRRGAEAWDHRTSTSSKRKLGLAAKAAVRVSLGRFQPAGLSSGPGLSVTFL